MKTQLSDFTHVFRALRTFGAESFISGGPLRSGARLSIWDSKVESVIANLSARPRLFWRPIVSPRSSPPPTLHRMLNASRSAIVIVVLQTLGIRWGCAEFRSTSARRGVGLWTDGSGKSTVLRILGTLLNPTPAPGRQRDDIVREPTRVRLIGYWRTPPAIRRPHRTRNLRFAAACWACHTRGRRQLERVARARRGRPRTSFSAGMQRRLALRGLIMRTLEFCCWTNRKQSRQRRCRAHDSVITISCDPRCRLVALHELAPAKAVLARSLTLVEGRIEETR